MKKMYFFLLIISVIFSSCFTRINLERTGSLVLAVKLPENDKASGNLSRAINVNTAVIKISIYLKDDPSEYKTMTINHSSSNTKHEVEFTDLSEGQWNLKIEFVDSGSNLICSYENVFEITENGITTVKTSDGGLRKITEAYTDSENSEMYISDGAVDVSRGKIAVKYLGNVFSDVSPDEANIKFILADNPEFQNAQTDIYPTLVAKGAIAYMNIAINNEIAPNTTYYWKVLVESVSNGTELVSQSNVFTFTTGATGSPAFTAEDKAKFQEFLTKLEVDAIAGGYTLDAPTVNDAVMEVVATDSISSNTATFTLIMDNGLYVWTEVYVEAAQTYTNTEIYADIDTWLFYATHDIQNKYISDIGEVKIIYIREVDYLRGYIFNEADRTWGTQEIVTVELWSETGRWKTATEKNLSGETVGILQCDSRGKDSTYTYKTPWSVDGIEKPAIGVNDYTNYISKIYLPVTYTGLDITGAMLVYENNWSNASVPTWKNYDEISGVLMSRGYTENGVLYNFQKLTSPVYNPSTGETLTVDVLSETQYYETENYFIEKYYLGSTCDMGTLEKSGSSILVHEYNTQTGIQIEYDVNGDPVPLNKSIKRTAKLSSKTFVPPIIYTMPKNVGTHKNLW